MYMTKKLAKKALEGITFGDVAVGAKRLGAFKDPVADGLKKMGVKKRF
jgi:hypothetical protein